MFQAQDKEEKSLLIVHSVDTGQSAELLSGLIGEMARSGYPINAVVYEATRFASVPDEQKHARQKTVYIGDFPESNAVADNIHEWKFENYGIRYGWHGNKAAISFVSELSENDYFEMALFAKVEMKEYESRVIKEVETKGLDPRNHIPEFNDALASGALAGGLMALAKAPIIGKALVGVGALLAAKVTMGVAALATVGGIIAMVNNKDNLNTRQIKEQQQKFAVLYFYLKHLADFMEL